jgi:23S rRNA (guanosine2251-2'-O)-methyltransferase
MTENFYIGGKHAVFSALKNPERKVHQVFITRSTEYENINFKNVKIVDQKFFKKIFKNINLNHQNCAALVSPLRNYFLKEEINNNLNKLIILNGVSDQRNIGSIIRTVLALGFDGIILEKKFFNQKNPIMIKASSGAIEYLKIFIVSNIKNEIKILKKNNYWITGLDSNSKKEITCISPANKIVLIFGSEDRGIKNSVLKNCDEIIKIPMNEKIQSLNVSNTVAATLGIIKFTTNLSK